MQGHTLNPRDPGRDRPGQRPDQRPSRAAGAGPVPETTRIDESCEQAVTPTSPIVMNPSQASTRPETAEQRQLRNYLATLDDDHQARLHAIYGIGRDLPSDAERYPQLYHYALTTDLGHRGAAYLGG